MFLCMKQTAEILKFKGETLKTLQDVQAVELAVLADLGSGAVTAMEARQIHIQIIAMLKQFLDTPLIVLNIRLNLPGTS